MDIITGLIVSALIIGPGIVIAVLAGVVVHLVQRRRHAGR